MMPSWLHALIPRRRHSPSARRQRRRLLNLFRGDKEVGDVTGFNMAMEHEDTSVLSSEEIKGWRAAIVRSARERNGR